MSGGLAVDRRTTLAWLAAALAIPESARGSGLDGTSWPAVQLTPVTAPGYGVDPDLLNPKIPWPLTLTKAELEAAAALCDMILPADGQYSAASAVGVPAFIDEWVSAPYPRQQQDRALIVPGLAWTDAESTRRFGKAFADATAGERAGICDDVAFAGRVKPGFEKPAAFFANIRRLTLRAYYSTEEGWAQVGYMGNTPGAGPYPGPTPEAMAHIQQVIAQMTGA
ncbi:MAG: gluconate 2-dehydrogenase subunit 3 family protein [Pseudomonadota bacterium]